MKQKKISELKLKYGYKSDAEESDVSSESEDEKIIKKVHKTKTVKSDDSGIERNTKTPVLDLIRSYGF